MRLEELVLISRPSLVQEEGSNERLHQPKQEVEVQQQDQDVKEEQESLHIAEAVEVIINLLIFIRIFKQFFHMYHFYFHFQVEVEELPLIELLMKTLTSPRRPRITLFLP